MNRFSRRFRRDCRNLIGLLLISAVPALAQTSQPRSSDMEDGSIEAKVTALSASLDQTRAELAASREEVRQLRELVEKVSERLDSTDSASGSVVGEAVEKLGEGGPQDPAQNQARITQDDWDVLNSRMAEQRQVKVESGSKFPLRLSGIVLMNSLVLSGRVDNFDLPATATSGSTPNKGMGFSLRQSIIGLEGTGPHFLGAATSADIQADFFGGMPTGYETATSGLMRLRLARIRMDWKSTSIIGGVDTPFFSPNSPSTYLTIAAPGFAAAGNLWTWSPVVRIEQRFDTKISQFKAEAGVLDVPSYAPTVSGARVESPAERTQQPAYAVRVSANGRNEDRPLSLGVSGIYFQQRFPGPITSPSWGGAADWQIPLVSHLEFNGEFFYGQGLDGFGAAPVPLVTTQNYLQYISSSAPTLARMKMVGGWSQLKIRVNARDEFNAAVGGVSRDADAFRQAALTDSIIQAVAFKNESLMVNYIYRPRSDLVFSAEYRRIRTYTISGSPAVAGLTGLSAGFIF